MKDRIKHIRKDAEMTQEQFGKRLGVSRGVIANLELGLTTASNTFASHLCEVFRINRRWLETGEGEMYEPDPKDLIDQIAAERNLGEGAKMLLRIGVRIFEELGPEALDRIIEETIPAIMAERGIPAATLAAERAQPIDNEAEDEIPG